MIHAYLCTIFKVKKFKTFLERRWRERGQRESGKREVDKNLKFSFVTLTFRHVLKKYKMNICKGPF